MNTFTWADRVEITKAYKNWEEFSDPYFYFNLSKLTPIERRVWADIRYMGLPMYPQFPIGKYFVDFADPVKKIVIEVDGAMWHDKKHDDKREDFIRRNGWEVIRIKGCATLKPDDNPQSSFSTLQEIQSVYYQ